MRMSTGIATRKTTLALVAAASALALVAAGAPAASAAPAAIAQATPKCWEDVVNDWLQHGTVTKLYALPCYTQAIQRLNAYPDIKQYSSAIDDIQRALLIARREESGGPRRRQRAWRLEQLRRWTDGRRLANRRLQLRRRPRPGPRQVDRRQARTGQRAVDPAPAARPRRPRPPAAADGGGDVGHEALQARRVPGTPAPARAGSSVRPEP